MVFEPLPRGSEAVPHAALRDAALELPGLRVTRGFRSLGSGTRPPGLRHKGGRGAFERRRCGAGAARHAAGGQEQGGDGPSGLKDEDLKGVIYEVE